MSRELISSSTTVKGVRLDPRTKLLLLVLICLLVVGGQVSGIMMVVRPLLALVALLLLYLTGKKKAALISTAIYAVFFLSDTIFFPEITGTLGFVLQFFSGLIARILPGMVMGYYTVRTTTVSELIAALKKIHLTEKIIIPLAVMFRFFPTVMEEYQSIGDAMRMRGIRIGGKKKSKMMEYRLIPMMICSVKIGEELSAAALTRGLGAPVKRTNICEIGFQMPDILVMLMCSVLFVLSMLGNAGVL